MRLHIIWAYIKWCLYGIFGGLIERHHLFVKTMRRETTMALLLSVLVGVLFIGFSTLMCLLIGPSEREPARDYAQTTMMVASASVITYVIAVGIIASWKSFCSERQELFELLKGSRYENH